MWRISSLFTPYLPLYPVPISLMRMQRDPGRKGMCGYTQLQSLWSTSTKAKPQCAEKVLIQWTRDRLKHTPPHGEMAHLEFNIN